MIRLGPTTPRKSLEKVSQKLTASLTHLSKGNEWKIYDYVTRHFIATLHDDMTYVERTAIIDIGGHRLVCTLFK